MTIRKGKKEKKIMLKLHNRIIVLHLTVFCQENENPTSFFPSSMEASTGPQSRPNPPLPPNLDNIKQKLLKHGIQPTPKILHTLRKKELQKSNRHLAKHNSNQPPLLTDPQKQAIAEETHFQIIKSEYKKFIKSMKFDDNKKLVGMPWEGLEKLRLRELASQNAEYGGEKLKPEHLRELSDIIECERDKFSWLLDDDIELENGWFEKDDRRWVPRKRSEAEAIKFLTDRLSGTDLKMKDWKFSRMMRQSGLQFTEGQMLKIVEGLGDRGQWRHALSVVEWLYNSKEFRHYKSRFVYTKLLAVLGRAGKPREALRVFTAMREDAYVYPDMAAYHSLAVTLGQTGFLKELVNVIESMKEKPKKIRNMRHKSWDPALQPDIVIYNAVLNACVPSCQWKGVSWVFEQLRKNGLRPNGASYGLAMEVMLQSRKYDLVHELFGKMKRSGDALKALTYRVLVKAFWEEGKVNEAVQAVRDMERRGVVGIASVYYELARCLCFHGRWQEAMLEIEKLKKLRPTRPLAVTFSGIILSSMDGGHVNDCVSIFELCKTVLAPDIGIINVMLKVYGQNDMFLEAKELFEETKKNCLWSEISIDGHGSSPKPDACTYGSMLEASASSLQWEYFEYMYKEMTLSGHRLDQNKHSALLVGASRAGKWHLLEHAFDTILEAGEIPPISFFSEMVCQAIAQRDYERAVNIINTMALAPFQVSFQQWIDLFEINGDVIDQASLHELQETLVSRDLVKEATVLNLVRVLQVICGYSVASGSSMIDKIASDCRDAESNGHEGRTINNLPANLISSGFGGNANIHEGNSINRVHDNKTNTTREEMDKDLEKLSGLSHVCHEGDGSAGATRLIKHLDCDLTSDILADEQEFNHIENVDVLSDVNEFNLELIMPTSHEIDDSLETDVPSAYDILESWKKMRKA